VKQIDTRPDRCEPRRPNNVEQVTTTETGFPALEPGATEPSEDESVEL
jgi:hypothetical protein